jgi:hypothetical protein
MHRVKLSHGTFHRKSVMYGLILDDRAIILTVDVLSKNSGLSISN